jgi:hypothetical protein
MGREVAAVLRRQLERGGAAVCVYQYGACVYHGVLATQGVLRAAFGHFDVGGSGAGAARRAA